MAATPAITFDYAYWVAAYPAFANVGEPLAQAYFDQAGSYCANVTTNPAFCTTVFRGATPTPLLTNLLDLLTAHLAWLQAPRDASGNPASTGQPPSGLVGRIASASEGSVSVSTENQYAPGSAQWFQQTPWGSQYWAATLQFRQMRYSPKQTLQPDGIFPYYPR
jgi:hypothetical protein